MEIVVVTYHRTIVFDFGEVFPIGVSENVRTVAYDTLAIIKKLNVGLDRIIRINTFFTF